MQSRPRVRLASATSPCSITFRTCSGPVGYFYAIRPIAYLLYMTSRHRLPRTCCRPDRLLLYMTSRRQLPFVHVLGRSLILYMTSRHRLPLYMLPTRSLTFVHNHLSYLLPCSTQSGRGGRVAAEDVNTITRAEEPICQQLLPRYRLTAFSS